MQLTLLVATLFASAASARVFTIYSNSNFWGLYEVEKRGNDNTCCMWLLISRRVHDWVLTTYITGNLNGKGDSASSVRGDGCSTFYR
jgi:hypothetical protein